MHAHTVYLYELNFGYKVYIGCMRCMWRIWSKWWRRHADTICSHFGSDRRHLASSAIGNYYRACHWRWRDHDQSVVLQSTSHTRDRGHSVLESTSHAPAAPLMWRPSLLVVDRGMICRGPRHGLPCSHSWIQSPRFRSLTLISSGESILRRAWYNGARREVWAVIWNSLPASSPQYCVYATTQRPRKQKPMSKSFWLRSLGKPSACWQRSIQASAEKQWQRSMRSSLIDVTAQPAACN